jgi:general secretion pathway protein D
MEVFQESSSVLTVDPNTGPVTNTRSLESTVLVDDGAIIALGGLVEDSYTSGEEKVPVLGDLPLAGALFRYETRNRAKTNLIVFLRPVILRGRDSYAGITRSRYDYIIGRQRETGRGDPLLKGEENPPELPPIESSAPAVPLARLPAPVEEAGWVAAAPQRIAPTLVEP